MAMTGGCLCGKVRYELSAPALFGGFCYCTDCRKTASSHTASLAVPAAAFKMTGPVKVYSSRGDSGGMVDRSFCAECGTHLLAGGESRREVLMLKAGTLDDPELFRPMASIYVSRAPSWDQPVQGLPAFPEMPPQG